VSQLKGKVYLATLLLVLVLFNFNACLLLVYEVEKVHYFDLLDDLVVYKKVHGLLPLLHQPVKLEHAEVLGQEIGVGGRDGGPGG